MSVWQYLLLLAGGLLVVFFACLLPQRFFRLLIRLALNAAGGLALLILVNSLTGLILPLNALTIGVSSLLGVPGMLAVTAIAAI